MSLASHLTITLQAGTDALTAHNGDEIEAYVALPQNVSGPVSGVVVIHHMPGFDAATKEITRRFAAEGYAAICPNLHYREAPGADPDDAAAAYLRALPGSSGKVGVIGFCSGGRQAFLSGLTAGVDAAVDCYGAFVVGEPPAGFPVAMAPLVDRTAELSCPLLGMFGKEDKAPP